MSFTILFALLALLMLVVVFFGVLRIKGLKPALIVTGIAFVFLTAILVGAISMIVSSMPN